MPTEISNKEFGKAKTILAEADFMINQYSQLVPFERQGFNKNDMLKKLIRAGELFRDRCLKNDELIIKKSGSYEAGIQLKTQTSRSYEALTICF